MRVVQPNAACGFASAGKIVKDLYGEIERCGMRRKTVRQSGHQSPPAASDRFRHTKINRNRKTETPHARGVSAFLCCFQPALCFEREHAPHSSACTGMVYKTFFGFGNPFSFTERKVPIHRISHRPRRRRGCRPQSLRPRRREKCRARATARPRPAADAPARTSATRCR